MRFFLISSLIDNLSGFVDCFSENGVFEMFVDGKVDLAVEEAFEFFF